MPLIHFEVDLHDGATSALEQIVTQARAAGLAVKSGMEDATPAVRANAAAQSGLVGVIRESRQEHRMAMFAVREGAGALTGLTGANKELAQGMGAASQSIFSMQFALEALAAGASRAGGSLAAAGAMLQTFILPIALAAAAFAFIRDKVVESDAASKELTKDIKDLKGELGIIPTDKVSDLAREYTKAMDEATKAHEHSKSFFNANWAILWRSTIDQATFGATSLVKNYLGDLDKSAEKAGLNVTKATKDRIDAEAKLNTEMIDSGLKRQEILFGMDQHTEAQKVESAHSFTLQRLKNAEAAEQEEAKTHDDYANMKGVIDGKYQAKRREEDAQYTASLKTENEKRLLAGFEFDAKQSEHDEASQSAIESAQIQLARAQSGTWYTLKTEKLRQDNEFAKQELVDQEETAREEEIRTVGLYANLTQIHQVYSLKRQALDAETEKKVEEYLNKGKDAHSKYDLSITDMESKVQDSIVTGFGTAIGQAILQAKNLGDAFVQVGERILEELLTMIAEAAIFDALMGLMSGGGTAGLGLTGAGAFNPVRSVITNPLLPGHASGADFTVPPGYEGDRFPLGFANSGEHVSITPAGQQGGSSGSPINIYVSAMDAKSFSDFMKQGSIKDAVMTAIRQQTSTGR